MSATSSIESLREALAPVEALRGEHSQLESWVRESFSAMDALHGELSDWQRDLTRQQALLDQREAALKEGSEAHESEAVAALDMRLAEAREETRQLEDENAEQLQAIEELDRQLAIMKAEVRLANKHADELTTLIETERERAAEEQGQWTAELREIRCLMERQGAMLDRLTAPHADDACAGASVGDAAAEEESADEAPDVGVRAAELRRRANSRRAGRRPG